MKRLWRATINSWHGLIACAQSEAAFREELALLVVGVPLTFFLTPDIGERFALIGMRVFVLIVELLNAAVEKLSERASASRTWAPPPSCYRCWPPARRGSGSQLSGSGPESADDSLCGFPLNCAYGAYSRA